MSKPSSNGISFFSLDCSWDSKITMYLLETNGVGLAVVISIWQLIYSNEGYYIQYDKDLPLLIKQRINDDIPTINVCINKAIERGLFDKTMFEQYGILTSSGIQKRYFDASKRKKEVKVYEEYLLKNINANIYNLNVNILKLNAKKINIETAKEKEKVKVKEEGYNTPENFSNFSDADSEKEIIKSSNNKKEKQPDFINELIQIFAEEYKVAKGIEYEITTRGKERSNMQKILANYKTKNPEANTEKTLNDFKEFFNKCLNVTDAWLFDNCTIPFINSQFAKYKSQIYGKKADVIKPATRKEKFIQDWESRKIFKKNNNGEQNDNAKLQLPARND